MAASQHDGTVGVTPVSVEMADGTTTVTTLTGASIGQNGQIILTGDGSLGGISGKHTVCSFFRLLFVWGGGCDL